MNLFELFVKIGVDDQASGKLQDLGGKLGNGLATAAKIGTAAVGAAAAGITALTTAAVNNYAEYEQLVGGVETLFKTSADKVVGYAENAYKTAGLSANEYMETVTSFSASLLQSLDEDTEAATEYANQAITDMADNANKMGTSMEMIQNAYQGFAKQNYSMLDNLKLGYGGTASEMYRLLQRAAELDETFAKTAEFSIDSKGHLEAEFADITQAIHIVQTEMGITGTTAREAGRTISGSFNAMKSAWKNLVTGFADKNADIESLIEDLVTTIVGDGTENNLGVIGNVFPAIETALDGVVELIKGAAPKIIEILPGLVKRIVPSLISAATSMVNAVIEVLPDILQTIATAVIDNAPALIDAAVSLVESLVQGIEDNYQILVDGAIGIVSQLTNSFFEMLPEIVDLGLQVIISLATGIAENIDELLPTIIETVGQIVRMLTDKDTLSKLFEAAIKIIESLAGYLTEEETLNGLIDSCVEIISSVGGFIIDHLDELLDVAVKIIEALVEYLTDVETLEKLGTAAIEIIAALGGALINAKNDLSDACAELIAFIVEKFTGIDLGEQGRAAVKTFMKGAASALGGFIDMGGLGGKLAGAAQIKINGSHRTGLSYVPFDGYLAELHKGERVLTASEAKGYAKGVSFGDVVINIHGAKYDDEQSLAEAVAFEIQKMTDRRAAVYA